MVSACLETLRTKGRNNAGARFGINVNAICPGYVRTEMNEAVWDTENGQRLIQSLPRQRIGTVEDLDSLVLLLSSDESEMINGAVISIDDGMSLT